MTKPRAVSGWQQQSRSQPTIEKVKPKPRTSWWLEPRTDFTAQAKEHVQPDRRFELNHHGVFGED